MQMYVDADHAQQEGRDMKEQLDRTLSETLQLEDEVIMHCRIC